MSNNLSGQFIANTFQNLMQKPDLNKEEYFNGLGQQITVINRDAIGTIKMFYPIGGVIGDYFDVATGLGVVGTEWEGFALCDGRNGSPDLRGRFVGAAVLGNGSIGTNAEALKVLDPSWTTIGYAAGNTFSVPSIENIPPHKHQTMFWSPEDGDPWRWDGSYNYIDTNVAGNNRWYMGFRGDSPISGQVDWQAAGGKHTYVYTTNTADGTENVKNELELQSGNKSMYPPFTLLAFVVRVQ